MHQPAADAAGYNRKQAAQSENSRLRDISSVSVKCFYPVGNNTHFKVYRYEPLIFALLKVIEDVHKKLTTESLLNLMLIYKRLMIRSLKSSVPASCRILTPP